MDRNGRRIHLGPSAGKTVVMGAELNKLDKVVSLASGIAGDAELLVQQQIALVKAEIREELVEWKEKLLPSPLGLFMTFAGYLLVPFIFVDLILSLSDGKIPMWGAYAIVSLFLIGIGKAIVYFAPGRTSHRTTLTRVR